MKKHNYLFFIVLTLLSLQLSAFELPSSWLQANLGAPTVFSANQYAGSKIINSINIFTLENDLKAVQGLKAKIARKDLKSVGDGYIVSSYKALPHLKETYLIEAKNLRLDKSFTQIWKFGDKKTAVAQVTNFSQLDEKIKKEILKMLEEL